MRNRNIYLALALCTCLAGGLFFFARKAVVSHANALVTVVHKTSRNFLGNPSHAEKVANGIPTLKSPQNLSNFSSVAETLTEFKELKRKPIKSAADKKIQRALFADSSTRDVAKFLTEPETSVNAVISLHHQAAVAFLQEALLYNRSQAIESALGVIKETRIEDRSIPVVARELIAKDLAELMYTFTAQVPDFEARMKSAQTGPATQKILQNVKAYQASNIAASKQAIAARENRAHNK